MDCLPQKVLGALKLVRCIRGSMQYGHVPLEELVGGPGDSLESDLHYGTPEKIKHSTAQDA